MTSKELIETIKSEYYKEYQQELLIGYYEGYDKNNNLNDFIVYNELSGDPFFQGKSSSIFHITLIGDEWQFFPSRDYDYDFSYTKEIMVSIAKFMQTMGKKNDHGEE